VSVPFYDFPSSPILIIGAIGIVVAIAVFFVAYQKYFNSPLNRELTKKKKALIKEQKDLNERLEKIEQDLKNLGIKKSKS
jgi:beta-lactamase regulating signal transducer with metallopeptidase domain